ncbi:SPRY domain-containing protein 4 [Manis pentadactyla]|uniref:SPRY domain-containing protein 4 n=1 Tax=Manis pentadactyla TaxID=143292 RepID=UPI001873C04D|nr:SPRY domain-containing protein 4 [Manis pentadactyla]KAI5220737.1 Spry Domain-Containing Protein 4 [Manis pentadactyla]
MALPFARVVFLCRWGAKRWGIATAEARRGITFKLEEKTAHNSLALFRDDTGVKYGLVGLEPTKLAVNAERFLEWAVVLADTAVTSGRHYWEVTVQRSQQFRIGVADVDVSRDSCIGADDRSWVFTYAQRKWHTMSANEKAPIEGIGQPEKVGPLLEYEAHRLSLVDVSRLALVHTLQTDFRGPVVPAFALWDGELLTHLGLEVPEGL